MNPEDPMGELYSICEYALQEAEYRALYDDEIQALRYAAAIPVRRAAACERGIQLEIPYGTDCFQDWR